MRVYLAAERTMLAWVRTGLALMGFGFLVARFGLFLREMATIQQRPLPQSSGMSLWLGTTMVALGVLVTLFAAGQQVQFVRRLQEGQHMGLRRGLFVIFFTLVLAVLGVVTAIYLLLSA
jgi:putative membrane protein